MSAQTYDADFVAEVGQISREIGWESCLVAFEQAGRDTARYASATTWRHPRHVEVEKQRVLRNDPCGARCGRCSRCIRADAWTRRGGRDYLGVRAEQQIPAASA